MDEQVLALLGSLVEIRTELGAGVYEAAVERARLAVAAEVMVEAERRALKRRRCLPPDGNVIDLAGARRSRGEER
ncbi:MULTISPECIES: hypothetical protein [unclassified Methylobacterium]|uniref:hypothetical protein n=1 Tax=unclassified Methylobacterium TaxID=2615210 RepID=UPI0011C2045C|nr:MULTISPECIES: hypothetical protein [unclassified Methylobacterium]QEE41008.1 hypothetical protein FVA80_20550 [Methylobacterium sp. WL1]TXN58855.1 hypothetical protein FV241_04545 [Methylobacterium sp. WL2]